MLGADGTPAGTVTSGSFCPWLDKSLAMAYVAARTRVGRHAARRRRPRLDAAGDGRPAAVLQAGEDLIVPPVLTEDSDEPTRPGRVLLLFAAVVAAQPPGAANREAMKKLDYLVGQVEG